MEGGWRGAEGTALDIYAEKRIRFRFGTVPPALAVYGPVGSVCLDIRMRVLECTWAMDSDEMRRLQARPLPLPLLQGQVEQAVLLFGSEDSQQEQAQRVQSLMVHYQSGHGNYQLEQITPAGWYLLLAWILELDGQEMVSPRLHPELRKNCGDEVRAIWSEAGALLFPNSIQSSCHTGGCGEG